MLKASMRHAGAIRLDHGNVLFAEEEHAASVAAAMRVAPGPR